MPADLQVFRHDDASYLKWLDSNLNGCVLNVPRGVGGTVLRHQSTCRMIRGTGRTNWTGPNYFKVVAQSPNALDHWLATNWTGAVRECRVCRSLSSDEGISSRTLALQATPQRQIRIIRPQAMKAENTSQPQQQTVQLGPVVMPWRLWSMGPARIVIDDIEPQLASWDHGEHPNQRRLLKYLDQVRERVAPLDNHRSELALSLTIDLKRNERLYRGNDVENYLTPLVHGLGGERFVYAEVSKRVGGGSRILVGAAHDRIEPPAWASWSRRVVGSFQSSEIKRSIRNGLKEAVDTPLSSGPIEVHMAWRLSGKQNWVSLWKPTGDSMGPVLGEPRYPQKEFHPSDERITKLMLHRITDDTLGRGVADVGLWWAPIAVRG